VVAVNADTSRRSFLTGTLGAGLGAMTEPTTSQRLDLDWAAFRLAELRVAHADGADTMAAFADLAARVRDAAYDGAWGLADRPRVLRLAADACSAAAGAAWGAADDTGARLWSRRGRAIAIEVGDRDAVARLLCTRALTGVFQQYPCPREALDDLARAAAGPLDHKVLAEVESHRAFCYALIAGNEDSKDGAYQALCALERAHTSAERAGSKTMVGWVETGAWATAVGLAHGMIGEPVRPMLERGLAEAGSARMRGGWLVALAEEDLRDRDYDAAGARGLAAVKVLGPAGAVRDLRRLGGVVRGLLARDPADEQARMLGGLLLEYRS
jgi:hypothetical protein